MRLICDSIPQRLDRIIAFPQWKNTSSTATITPAIGSFHLPKEAALISHLQ